MRVVKSVSASAGGAMTRAGARARAGRVFDHDPRGVRRPRPHDRAIAGDVAGSRAGRQWRLAARRRRLGTPPRRGQSAQAEPARMASRNARRPTRERPFTSRFYASPVPPRVCTTNRYPMPTTVSTWLRAGPSFTRSRRMCASMLRASTSRVVAPDALQQALAGEHAAGPLQHAAQQLELLGGEPDLAAAVPDDVGVELHLEVLVLVALRRRPRSGSWRRRAARQRAASSFMLKGFTT